MSNLIDGESKFYEWSEYQGRVLKMDYDEKLWSHTKTVARLKRYAPEALVSVLEKILDEAALTQHQGGALNYNWMLDALNKEARENG